MAVTCADETPAAKFVPLGDLGGLPFSSSALGVSPNGSIVTGSTLNAFTGGEAFRWTAATGMVSLGVLPSGAAQPGSVGNSVSADGTVVGRSSSSGASNAAFRWTSADGMSNVGFLGDSPPGSGNFSALAYGISADGAVVVGRSSSSLGTQAFRQSTAGGMVGLGDLAGGPFNSEARAVSADGSTIVGFGNVATGSEAMRWTSASGMVGLGDLPGGGVASLALGVSADGSVIVGQGTSAGGLEAFRWTAADGMTPLGDLPGGTFNSVAWAVSGDGSVIAGDSAGTVNEATIWTEGGGMQALKPLLTPSAGAVLTGWTLSNAYAVSYDGRTVVGKGINPSGATEAWLAYLPAEIYWFPETSGAWDSALSWSGPFLPGAADDVVINPATAATIAGPSTARTVQSLSLGGSGLARATLRLDATGGDLTATAGTTIYSDGELALADGRSFTTPLLVNGGVVRGSGNVNGSLNNVAGGEVRVAIGESLVISATAHVNSGKIEAIGGSLEMIGATVNESGSGLITGRNATLRFSSLENEGSLLFSGGANDVSGDVSNAGGGKIVVAGGASATFYDDVVQNGQLQVLKVGATVSAAVFAGAFSGSGGSGGGGDVYFLGDLRPGNSPAAVTFDNNVTLGGTAGMEIEIGGTAPGVEHDKVRVTGALTLGGDLKVTLAADFLPSVGQSFDVLDWGTLSGAFSTIELPSLNALAWDKSKLYTTGELSVAPAFAADFDEDGDVDGIDFNRWKAGFGAVTGATHMQGDANGDNDVDGSDFLVWQRQRGSGGPGVAAVPEPAMGSLVAIVLGVVGAGARRRSGVAR